jgi:hypothetical protein
MVHLWRFSFGGFFYEYRGVLEIGSVEFGVWSLEFGASSKAKAHQCR